MSVQALPQRAQRGRRRMMSGLAPKVLVAAAALVAVYLAIPSFATAEGVVADTARNIVAFVSLTGMGVCTYVTWPSRWNVPAHLQLAFAVPAYIIPLLVLGSLNDADPSLVALYVRLLAVGFVATTAGVLIGGWIADRWFMRASLRSVVPWIRRVSKTSPPRVLMVAVGAIVVLLVCFVIMGFAPALAEDPSAAKFFKGVYHEPYEIVSVPYRIATTVIPLFLPLVGVYAWTRRRQWWWMLVLAAAVGVMLLCLLREPAVSGVLIAVGMLVAFYRRFFVTFLVVLVLSYIAGSAMYVVLALLGVSGYENLIKSGQAFWSAVASGAPDVKDQLQLLAAWLPEGALTWGRTFVGGLIPGNFPWNPSVWTLTTLNPTLEIEEINSGGLRLPAPIWGLVSFSWIGAVAVPLLSGVFAGVMSRIAAHTMPRLTLEQAGVAMIVYLAIIEVVPSFYRLSYLSVLGVVVVVVVLGFTVPRGRFLWWGRRRTRERVIA